MKKRIAVYMLCLLVVTQPLGGCAGMSEQQKGGAAGAGIGALLGGVAGGLLDSKNPGRGAALGALAGGTLGGAVGWAVGEYRVRRVKSFEEAASEASYTPAQGLQTKVDRTAVVPQRLRPGDKLTLKTQYTVLAPRNDDIQVTEAHKIFFNNQPVEQLPPKHRTLKRGTDETSYDVKLPMDLVEGQYIVVTTVEPMAMPDAAKAKSASSFVVVTAAAVSGDSVPLGRRPPREPAQSITPAQWHALGQTVATNLARAGVPPSYVPALTQEYLGAFQHALRQGATMQQADTVASRHLTAVHDGGEQRLVSPGTQSHQAGCVGST